MFVLIKTDIMTGL